MLVLCVATGRLVAQEQTLQVRLTGAWLLHHAAPSADPSAAREPKKEKDDPSLMAGTRQQIQLATELRGVPDRMAIMATTADFVLTDEYGVRRQFAASGKAERVDFGSNKVMFRTTWKPTSLAQDITSDGFDMTRTFEVPPEGRQLILTLTIRRQPDPNAQTPNGVPEVLRFVYDRAQ
jgi:hypothetical protein